MDNLDNETIVRQLQQGTGNRNELLEMLWNQNLRLVRKIIHESTGLDHWKDQDFEDLEQQAFLGILESVSRFDFDQGNRFFTYATHYIIQSIRKYYDRYGQILRIPPDMSSLEKGTNRTIKRMTVLLYGIDGIDPERHETGARA